MRGSSSKVLSYLRSLYRIGLWMTDFLVALLPKGKNRGAVLVMGLDRIGDFIIWFQSAKELGRIYPDQEMVLLASPIIVDFALRLGYWDQVWPFQRDRFGSSVLYRSRLLFKIRRFGFDVAMNPLREFRISDSIIRVSAARERIGSNGNETYRGRAWETAISDRWYSKIIDATPRREGTAIHNFFEFVNGIQRGNIKPRLPCIPRRAFDVPHWTVGMGSYYVLFMGCSDMFRAWPIERFIVVAGRLWREFGLKGVICGGTQEIQMASRVLKAAPKNSLISVTGKTTICELIGIINQAKLYIGNETGAAHIAAAVRCPAVCITGGGDFGYFMPYPADLRSGDRPLPVAVYQKMDCFKCVWKCIHPVKEGDPAPCISAITIDKVWEVICQLLGRNRDVTV